MKSELSIPLGNEKYATIDLCDLDKIEGWTFYLHQSNGPDYAKSSRKGWAKGVKRKSPTLHHLVLGVPPAGLECAHLDGNGLNCTRRNLRWLTHVQNMQGKRKKWLGASSQYRGVSWNKDSKKWTPRISVNKKLVNLGKFDSELEAAKAYDSAAREYFGEHAAPNFPI